MSETSADRCDLVVSEPQNTVWLQDFGKLREVLVLVCTSAHSSEFSIEVCHFFLSPQFPPSNFENILH